MANDPNIYFGVIKTSDGGATWSVVTKEAGQMDPSMHDSWLGYRFGPDWGEQPVGLGVDANNPNLVYRTDLGRIMRSTNGGSTWEAVYSQGTDSGYTTTGLDVTTCYGLHFDPFDRKRMFISYTDIGLFRSEDGGRSWISSTTNGVPHDWLNTTYWVEFDPAVKGKMWAVMTNAHDIPRFRMLNSPEWKRRGGGVHRRREKLEHIRAGAAANGRDPHPAGLEEPAGLARFVRGGMGRGVFKSGDGGQTWTEKNTGLPPKPLTWRMSMDRNGTLYVVTIRRSQDGKTGTDQDGAVYRSRDGAESWERFPLPSGVNGPVSLTVDPEDSARIYLSAWGRYTQYAGANPPDGGVFLTIDGGKSWRNVMNGNRRVYDVTVDPRNPNIVYACGFDASAWRSADRGKRGSAFADSISKMATG